VVVVPKVELDPPQKDSGEMERHGEKDRHMETKEPEVHDKAPNADAAIRGNVEFPPPGRGHHTVWQGMVDEVSHGG
jgi:hypothetical protein